MRKKGKATIRKIVCMLTAAALLAGSIPPAPAEAKSAAVKSAEATTEDETAKDTTTEESKAPESEDSAAEESKAPESEGSAAEESKAPESEGSAAEESKTPESEAAPQEPQRPAPEGYVLGGSEEIHLNVVKEQYIIDNTLCLEKYFQVELSGYHDDETYAGQTLSVEVSIEAADNVYASTAVYTFDADAVQKEEFRFCCSAAGDYCISAVIKGLEWDEAQWCWQEKEVTKTFPLHVEKLPQRLRAPAEELTLSYGDTVDLEAYVKEKLRDKEALYSERLELSNQAADKLQLTGMQLRAVGICPEATPAHIRVRYQGDEWFEESDEIDIPVRIEQVSPCVLLRMNQDSGWQAQKSIRIHDELALHATLETAEGAAYQDLLQQDTSLRLQYRIINEATGETKEYTQPLGWNVQTQQRAYHDVLPIGWRFFPKLHKNSRYRLEMAVIYTGTDSPYKLPPKQSCELTLQAADAYLKPDTETVVLDYRTDWNKSYEMPFSLLHRRLGADKQITEQGELEQIRYAWKSSDAKAVAVNTREVYTADKTSAATYKVTGVGKADIQLGIVQSPTYDIEEAAFHVEVADSPIREEDYRFCYENGKRYTYTQWLDYLEKHRHWLNAPFCVELTDTGREYYDTLSSRQQEKEPIQQPKITYNEERAIQEYALWMEHSTRHASTKEAGELPTFQVGIDSSKPTLIAIEHNASERFRGTSDDAHWYMGETLTLQGAYEDTLSGIARVEYTLDAGETWQELAGSAADKNVRQFTLQVTDGDYAGIGLRAYDVAGNVSSMYTLGAGKGQYSRISIDTRVPEIEAAVTIEETGAAWDASQWTKHALKYQLVSLPDNPAIYRQYYQYVPVHKVQEALLSGALPYQETDWQELSAGEIIAGADSEPMNRNGTWYFKQISVCGLESPVIAREIHLQQTLPAMQQPVIENDAGEAWYNAASAPARLSLSCEAYLEQCVKEGEYHAPITIYTELKTAGKTLRKELTVGFSTLQEYQDYCKSKSAYTKEAYQDRINELAVDFSQLADAEYEFTCRIEDAAGNKSEIYSHPFRIDTTPPTDLQVWLEGREYETGQLETIVYDTFSQSAVSGEVTAKDALSGIAAISVLQAKRFGEWKEGSATMDKHFTILPDTRCFLYVVARDEAGNETTGWTNGIVADASAPQGQGGIELLVEPQGANANGFFHDAAKISVQVQDMPQNDNNAGLESVSWQIISEQGTEQRVLYQGAMGAVSEETLRQSASFETTELVDAAKYEGNETSVEVTATDRAGNKAVSIQTLKLDVTAPVLELTFDEETPTGERFYHSDRTATIHVTERNFDENQVEWTVTRNGEPYTIGLSGWSSNGTEHTASMTFTEDGEYTIEVSCTDMADNEAEPVSADAFCIDQTAPLISIDYEGADAYSPDYYNGSRTAIISVTEHNFDEAAFVVDTAQPYQKLGWRHDGDRHELRLLFAQEGAYEWTCSYADMADNAADEVPLQEFCIDTQSPVITITGVMDNSANTGTIIPVVQVLDAHFYQEQTIISMTNGRGECIELTPMAQPLSQGMQYTLQSVNDLPDMVYYLRVSSLDMAGNEAALTYRFSLNRNGSAYDMSEAKAATGQVYYRSDGMKNLEFYEMNVDEVEQFTLYVTRNEELISDCDYRVEREGSAQLGYTYHYTLFKENFAEEGSYQVAFYSKDAAGNEVSSTLTGKDAGLSFIIDNTPPQVIFDGIEAGGVYNEPYRQVNVLFQDNGRLEGALIHLINEKGEEIADWDYMAQDVQEGSLTLTIPEYAGTQSFYCEAWDVAGNELSMTDKTDFIITTDFWIRLVKTTDWGRAAAQTGTIAAAGAGTFLLRRRRRRGVHA